MTKKSILAGESFSIHKEAGTERRNCRYVTQWTEMPTELRGDKSVVLLEDGKSVKLYAIEGPTARRFPVYVCWEPVSGKNRGKVPGSFNVWPKDNGGETLVVRNGHCFNKPATVQASLIGETIPGWVKRAGFPVRINDGVATLIRTDWGGDVRTGRVGHALWVQYGPRDVNILDLAEKSAGEYIVSDSMGRDVGRLTDILADLR